MTLQVPSTFYSPGWALLSRLFRQARHHHKPSATSGTTVSGENASQSSSQENTTRTNVSNNSIVTHEVFSYNVLVFVFWPGFGSHFLLPSVTSPLLWFFPLYSGAGFKLRAWSTWSVIYSFGLAMIQFF